MFRRLTRKLILDCLGQFKSPSKGTHILNGHFVQAIGNDIEQQKEILHTLIKRMRKQGDFVTPAYAVENISQKKEVQFCLSFDDGFSDCAKIIAPVLKAENINAIFFINPKYLGLKDNEAKKVMTENYLCKFYKEFLTPEEVKFLSYEGHVIGSHTHSHARLSKLSDAEIEEEITLSKSGIERITEKPCDYFAYPFGGENDLLEKTIPVLMQHHKYVFSSINNGEKLSFNGRVFNRRHFEGNWPASHINYFLSNR